MKKRALVLCMSLALGLNAMPALADRGDGAHWEEKRQEMEARKLERLTEELNLTADQQTRLKAILKQQGDKFEALHREMKSVKKETRRKIEAILTEEQKADFAEIKAKKKAQREEGIREKSDR